MSYESAKERASIIDSHLVPSEFHYRTMGMSEKWSELLAHAPTDLAAALKVIEAVKRLQLTRGKPRDAEYLKSTWALDRAIEAFEALP